MMEWLQKNAVSLIIAGSTIIGTYSIYGYRLDALELRQNLQEKEIKELQDNNLQTQIALAKIQVDIEYIKNQLNKLVDR